MNSRLLLADVGGGEGRREVVEAVEERLPRREAARAVQGLPHHRGALAQPIICNIIIIISIICMASVITIIGLNMFLIVIPVSMSCVIVM